MPYKVPYPYLPNLGGLQSGDIMPVLRPAFDEGSATIDDVQQYLQPYKKYVANLTQVSTDAPTAIEFENTLGVVIFCSYNSVGNYSIIASSSIFTEFYTWMIINQDVARGREFSILWGDDTTLFIRAKDSGSYSDDILSDTSIEIRVYNAPPP